MSSLLGLAPLIPRTRASFTLADLARAARTSEGSGRHRAALSAQLRAYLGVSSVLLTPSGRAGLHAILSATDRPRVIVPAYTCNAVIEAALLAGKSVSYAEIAPGGFNVDPDALEPLLGPDATFVATHQFGIPCAIERMVEMCAARGTLLVEDAAASLGTWVSGRPTGTFGDAAFFSFDISKLVTVPLKGGAVVARDPAFFARIVAANTAATEPMPALVKARLLAMGATLVLLGDPVRYRAFHALHFARTGRYTAESSELELTRGLWYRYDFAEWQAEIATSQMARIGQLVAHRQALYAEYERRLSGRTLFTTPPPDRAQEWAPIRFPIRVRGGLADKLAVYRAANRLGVDFAFSFTFIQAPDSFAASHTLAGSVLDLPFFEDLAPAEVDTTVRALLALDESPPC